MRFAIFFNEQKEMTSYSIKKLCLTMHFVTHARAVKHGYSKGSMSRQTTAAPGGLVCPRIG